MEKQVSQAAKAILKATLLEAAHQASTSSGVYLMRDAEGNLLYVGKAKNLKNRLSSYFQPAPHENIRTEILVSRIVRFDVILTETEAEALLLECTLIKKHQPKFNIRLKDDKAYPYLRIQVNEVFPRIEYVRKVQRDGARYFGPFPSAWSARQVMTLLTETYRLRDCSDNTFRHRSRRCILYSMGKCSGPCVPDNSENVQTVEQSYQASIQEIIEILEGRAGRLIDALRAQMEEASENEAFEDAAMIRDQIRNLEVVTQTQGVVEAGSQRNRDVLGLARQGALAHGTVLKIRGGRLISVQHFHLQNTDEGLSDAEVFADFLAQYYAALEKGREETERLFESGDGTPARDTLPQEVLLPVAPADTELLERTLGIQLRIAESSVSVDAQQLNVARTNAQFALESQIQSEKRRAASGHGLDALEEVQNKLHLVQLPHRIECYDISNIQGEDAVASRVVFIDGAADKNLYRRYKIRTVEGANDFAMMKEVLGRRFARTDEALPNLVVVDGGKGQLAQAVAILEELNVPHVSVVGLAKARTERDFKGKEVESSMERIFIPNRKNPVSLYPNTKAYRLLTHIRDEAHRFAVSYHRVVRSKRIFNSNED